MELIDLIFTSKYICQILISYVFKEVLFTTNKNKIVIVYNFAYINNYIAYINKYHIILLLYHTAIFLFSPKLLLNNRQFLLYYRYYY